MIPVAGPISALLVFTSLIDAAVYPTSRDLELQTKLLRMTGMLNEQQVISRAAQSDRVYRQLSTDVLYIVKRDGRFKDALVDIFNPFENTWQEFCHAPISRFTWNIVLNSKYPAPHRPHPHPRSYEILKNNNLTVTKYVGSYVQ
ncbi:unnamed protein product [Dibothriocephalus latus]|uniref:Uncharacterized protein n=1 Tax=Dibothriocephalus latus TaxID=60516 RepID=A0A3P7R5K9_DIBLA|nr:unnamed protein product [Dibothriocephalus latus]